jgi:hypothetical protein
LLCYAQVASRRHKLEHMGLEKTADGKKWNCQEHGIRRGANAHNGAIERGTFTHFAKRPPTEGPTFLVRSSDGDSVGSGTQRRMAGAALVARADPALRWGFADAAPLRSEGSAALPQSCEGTPAVSLRGAAFAYGAAGGAVLAGVELSLSSRCRVALFGANGARRRPCSFRDLALSCSAQHEYLAQC